MSEDAGYAELFHRVLFATVMKPISDLRLLISGSRSLPFALSFLGAMFFALCLPAQAQQAGKLPRIGLLYASASGNAHRVEAFRQGLRELGYVEGKNIFIEYRYADGKRDRFSAYAEELVRLKVDVIVTGGAGGTRPVKHATSSIPVVMTQDDDPVGNGFVASLARPGGNITGLATLVPELSGKRLELLKEVIPRLSRVAVFASSASRDYPQVAKEIELAAGAFGLKLQHVELKASEDFDAAFQAAAKGRADAILFRVPGPILNPRLKEVAELAVKSRLPAIYEGPEEVEAGGLMSYGVSETDLRRRAATYVDKILKGAKPADLPVQQPTKFELVINLKTAKQIGLAIPPEVLARATKLIK